MSELGQVLKEAREEKGITLDDIQRITKIQRRYLEAIERGHFHVLPGHFYARAFIKSYAEAVGLDPNHIMSHFQSDLPAQPPQEQLERLRRRRVATTSNPLQAGKWVTKTLLVLFVGLIIGVIYVAAVNSDGFTTQPVPGGNLNPGAEVVGPGQGGTPTPVPQVPQAQTPSPPAVTPETTPENGATAPGETPQSVLTFESQQGSLYKYTLTGGDKIIVKIKAVSDSCWYGAAETQVKKFPKQGTLSKDQEAEIELGKTAYIRLGKPSAVQVTVNGTPLDTSKLKFMPSNVSITLEQPVTQ
ncbi:RodZ domain-containing protein [Brevibacillus borstelensis]|uniref:RodZ domain-containing protein n=1 Tax=Brevibacillus borstelensis TaxID=45462 RepID=UPI0030C2D71F